MTKTNWAVAACATLLWIGTAQAGVAPQTKCEQAKLKAQGKLQACLKKNSAGILGGKADASADCQTKFTAALAKADAKATKAATSCRYLDNGDGTVSDLNTGLVWEKKDVNCPGPHCYSTTYAWSTGAPFNPAGNAFTTFLGTLNDGTSTDGSATSGCFAGHCDWRLPTVQELAGTVDLTAGNCAGGSGPCIDPAFGPTQASEYWSATTDSSNPANAWIVYFLIGGVDANDKTDTTYVRAVRGGFEVVNPSPAPGTAPLKCEQAKLKAQGKLQACLKKNSAGILGGKADASADCQAKFTATLAKADAKATKAGTSCRYLDNGDGTVSDLDTGLLWEKKDITCPGAHCVNDSYKWSSGGSAPDGSAFTMFLGTLDDGTSTDGNATSGCFAGHCDWRLPTIQELFGIVDLTASGCGSGSPCIDPAFNPTQAFYYWSATTDSSFPPYAWVVYFNFGGATTLNKPDSYYVRAVRGGL